MIEAQNIILENALLEILKDLEPHPIELIVQGIVFRADMELNGLMTADKAQEIQLKIYEAIERLVEQGKAEYVHGKNTVKGLPQESKGYTDTLPECPTLFEFYDGTILNLRDITLVSPVSRNVADKSYRIHFSSGNSMEVWSERMYSDDARTIPARYAPREKLIEAWKDAIKPGATIKM